MFNKRGKFLKEHCTCLYFFILPFPNGTVNSKNVCNPQEKELYLFIDFTKNNKTKRKYVYVIYPKCGSGYNNV